MVIMAYFRLNEDGDNLSGVRPAGQTSFHARRAVAKGLPFLELQLSRLFFCCFRFNGRV
ncbi:hypothetical protein BDA96_04G225000 [Sorghum bicolor]|uniref:Uncharacterized protein n=1 Tax=Sorghum bicolor TaxID=4558 RepID=A0A921R7B6_SORBI|nr:hypothetical protein BDA96_04G225000 [Sorghum bicolor]